MKSHSLGFVGAAAKLYSLALTNKTAPTVIPAAMACFLGNGFFSFDGFGMENVIALSIRVSCMLAQKSNIQKLSLVYAVIFLGVVLLNYIPAIHDAQGLMFGLFKLDPIDDLLHGGSGLWALGAGLYSLNAAANYFRIFGPVYLFDGLFGIAVGKGFLDGAFLSDVPAVASLLSRLELNIPHLLLGGMAAYIGYRLTRVYVHEARSKATDQRS